MPFLLIVLFSISLNPIFAATGSGASTKELFSGHKSLYAELGLSTSLMLSDLSNKTFALGLGNQFAIGMAMNSRNQKGFKFHIQRLNLKQNNWRKTSAGTNQYFRSFEQEWLNLSFGLEHRRSSRLLNWYWDFLVGYSFGRKSRIQIQGSDINDSIVNTEEPTRNGLHISSAIGMRKIFAPKFSVNANLRSFLLLGRPYSDQWKEKNFLILPLLSSVALEYEF